MKAKGGIFLGNQLLGGARHGCCFFDLIDADQIRAADDGVHLWKSALIEGAGLYVKAPFMETILKVDMRTQKTEATVDAASRSMQTAIMASATSRA
ncbi:MAG: hypothetical protein LBV61_04435 [Burkholderiaceae bacterium]|nr:hypothetical protein [Burkholderiaceae bacterium]